MEEAGLVTEDQYKEMDKELKETVMQAVEFAESSPEPALSEMYTDISHDPRRLFLMAIITFREALRQALDEEMARSSEVIVLGEEVAQYDGAYKVTKGLLDKYGENRVLDTPITELGFTGLAVGAAMAGMRPVVEWMTIQFGLLAIDQLINNAVKYRFMSGGQFKVPLVIRGPNGPAEYLSAQHSQSFASFFVHVPGFRSSRRPRLTTQKGC